MAVCSNLVNCCVMLLQIVKKIVKIHKDVVKQNVEEKLWCNDVCKKAQKTYLVSLRNLNR